MRDLFRLLLMLGIVVSAVTMVGSAIAYWMEERRRLARLAGRALGGAPDAVIIAQWRNAAAAFRLDAGQVLVMRDGGADALLYPMVKLQGAELLVDDQVVARVAEGEPRRPLERIAAGAQRVALRLIFDDARHPDFELDLWLPTDQDRRHSRTAAQTIQEARGWLTRAEAIMRRKALPPAPPITKTPAAPEPEARTETPPAPKPPPWVWDDTMDPDYEGEREIKPAPKAQAPSSSPSSLDALEDQRQPGGGADQLRLF